MMDGGEWPTSERNWCKEQAGGNPLVVNLRRVAADLHIGDKAIIPTSCYRVSRQRRQNEYHLSHTLLHKLKTVCMELSSELLATLAPD